MKTTGEKIKAAREAAGLTQQALAYKLCVWQVTVARWETDVYLPTADRLVRMAVILKVEPGKLIAER